MLRNAVQYCDVKLMPPCDDDEASAAEAIATTARKSNHGGMWDEAKVFIAAD